MLERKLKRAIIKEEYVEITGDVFSAVILNQFIYWLDKMRDVDEYITQERKRATENGSSVKIELTNGWIYKTAEELSNETMLGLSENTIRKYLQNLIDKGFLTVRTNENYKWDRTKQYRVDLVAIERALSEKGYHLSDYKIKLSQNSNLSSANSNFEFQYSETELQSSETCGAIPKITTKTTYRDNTPPYNSPKSQGGQKGGKNSTTPTYGLEEFLQDNPQIRVDNYNGIIDDMNFAELTRRIRESSWLQQVEDFSFFCLKYNKIISGGYKDIEKKEKADKPQGQKREEEKPKRKWEYECTRC